MLRQRGYRVVEGECLRQEYKSASASREQRAVELMRFLTDPGVAAVMPPWGGELAIELLPLLDFATLARLPPKWFVGFSDLSTLHVPLTTLAGWATLHGPNLMQLGWPKLDSVTAAIWEALTVQPGSSFTQRASCLHQRQDAGWPSANGPVFEEETAWKRLDGKTSSLEFTGRLIGGCIDTISRLTGTRFGNVPGFVEAAGGEGALLYLENAELKPGKLARALVGLRLCGWFDGVSAVLMGRNAVADDEGSDGLRYVDALQSELGDLPCPVIYDMDIGHVPPQLSLVNGALARVSVGDGGGTVEQWLG
ncbi:Muramoyltetrapeptide carboxypeptidase LdcA (peptidoglycan recycling) [Paraburkholderia phenazinium]|uniref:Muramoyltetrapeptide carboxypeptidase LdcA (Peptidoglycan recycling) n=2 Tax=Paraburkholderia phenazinium TaxID=60549 RepID=A0A1G8IHJ4_9BURK|nr:Muramoyltetrapeptide carboxypeptidase LdcA (peptidoglycan recycling) [Paraburkholderia phenazinium]